jgi:hypothetical protein
VEIYATLPTQQTPSSLANILQTTAGPALQLN